MSFLPPFQPSTPGSPGFPGGQGFPGGGQGFPGGGQGFPGGFPGGIGGQPLQPPTSPPPQFQPQQPTTFAVDPGAIQGCLFRYTYVWQRNGQQYWFIPLFVGRRSVAGFRWFGWRWGYWGVDTRQIVSFTCF